MNKGQSRGGTENTVIARIFGAFAAHPYIIAFVICIMTVPLFYCSAATVSDITPSVMFLTFCGVSSAIISSICKRHGLGFVTTLLLTVAAAAAGLLGASYFRSSRHKQLFVFCFGSLMLMALYYAFFRKKYKRQFNALLIMGMGFMVKLIYVLGTSVYERQHDIGWFGGEEEIAQGHMGYISYLFHNYRLYDGDYRQFLQYCHPPLHHAVSALWIKLMNGVFGVDMDRAVESVQILPLFYSLTIIITAYKLFRYFRLDGCALYVPLMITAFHPCFTFLAGLMNNDALAWAFTMGAVLYTLKWYSEPSMKNILMIALCMGLGMMTKLSTGLAAPPIAMVFLTVFLRERKKLWKKIMGQFAAFGAVCVPLGMWFPIRGRLRWGIPLTYVQELPEMDQTIKGVTFRERITDFAPYQFRRVFENWLWYDGNGDPQSYNEHNPLIAIMKNSVFGEFVTEGNFTRYSFMENVCKVLFWLAAAVAAVAFVVMVISLFRKTAADSVQKFFLFTFHILLLANLYNLSRSYPMVCSMNFRYLMPTVITGALFLGMTLVPTEKKSTAPAKAWCAAVTGASAVFALLSGLVYFVVGIGG